MNHRSVECKTIRQKNMYDNIHNFEFGDNFFDIAPKAQIMKEIMYKLYFIKTMWTELKASYTLGENICKRQIFGQQTKKKDSYPKHTKNSPRRKPTTWLLKKGLKTSTDISLTKRDRWQVSILKDAPHHLS